MAHRPSSLFTFTALAVLAWSTFAFGGVYPWAYWPVLIGAVTTGVLGIVTTPFSSTPSRAFAVVFIALGLAIGLQITPLPGPISAQLRATARRAPALEPRATFSQDIAYAGPTANDRLSLDPAATSRALMFVGALGILFWGTLRALTARGARDLTAAIVWLGVVVALLAIVQRAVSPSKIYGFWLPYYEARPFGPFINYNHFAGWMLMATALGIGCFCARLGVHQSDEPRTLRTRVLSWSSANGCTLVLLATSVLVMSIAITLTVSRSGVMCLALMLGLGGWHARRLRQRRIRRAFAIAYLAGIGFTSIAWAGTDVLAERFAAVGMPSEGRLAIWRQTVPMIREHWLFGVGVNAYPAASASRVRLSVGTATEAHNDYLQLAAEGGVLVVVPALLLTALFIKEVSRRFREDRPAGFTRWLRTGAVIGLITISAQELVEFSLQIPANAVLFTFLCAIAVHRPSAGPAGQNPTCVSSSSHTTSRPK